MVQLISDTTVLSNTQSIIMDGLKLLLKVLMRHDVIIATERLYYLLPVLINRNRLAETAASTLTRHSIQRDSAGFLTHLLGDGLISAIITRWFTCFFEVRIDCRRLPIWYTLLYLDLLRSKLRALYLTIVSPFIE